MEGSRRWEVTSVNFVDRMNSYLSYSVEYFFFKSTCVSCFQQAKVRAHNCQLRNASKHKPPFCYYTPALCIVLDSTQVFTAIWHSYDTYDIVLKSYVDEDIFRTQSCHLTYYVFIHKQLTCRSPVSADCNIENTYSCHVILPVRSRIAVKSQCYFVVWLLKTTSKAHSRLSHSTPPVNLSYAYSVFNGFFPLFITTTGWQHLP